MKSQLKITIGHFTFTKNKPFNKLLKGLLKQIYFLGYQIWPRIINNTTIKNNVGRGPG